jgi:hypothetical protein
MLGIDVYTKVLPLKMERSHLKTLKNNLPHYTIISLSFYITKPFKNAKNQ